MAALTIRDLMQRFHLERRAIHTYFREGLVAKPDFRGRFTVYTEEHAERIRVVCHLLRVEQLTIQEAKARLAKMKPEAIAALGRAPSPHLPPPPPEPRPVDVEAWVRTALIAGVELHVSTTATAQAKELAESILALARVKP